MSIDTEIADNILEFIAAYTEEHPMPPSMREIAEGCFIAYGTVIRYLDIMEVMGCVQRESGKARSVSILKRKTEMDQMIDHNDHTK